MRAVKSFFLHDLILKLARATRRLNCINIKSGANATTSHRRGERLLIDNFSTRRVAEVSAFLHRLEEFSAQQMFGFRIESEVNTHNIRRTRNSFRRLFQLNTQQRSALSSQTTAPRHNGHPKRMRARNHLLTNLSNSNQTKRATIQTTRFYKLCH